MAALPDRRPAQAPQVEAQVVEHATSKASLSEGTLEYDSVARPNSSHAVSVSCYSWQVQPLLLYWCQQVPTILFWGTSIRYDCTVIVR